jgi:hypothetical protein
MRFMPVLAALCLTGCGAPGAGGPEPWEPLGEWIGAERARLAEVAAGLGEDGEEIAAELAGVAETAEAGRLLLAADRLSSPRLGAEARAYRSERRDSVTDLAALEAEARAVASEIGRLEARAAEDPSGRPAALRALADAAWVRGYHGAAVSYARVTSVSAGLFYLGAGRSLVATAADLAGLPVAARAPGAGPSAEALEAELAELDRRTIAAYRAPGAEVEHHSAFIALNAEVKEARDLLAAGRPDGALLAALESRRRLEEVLDEGAGPGAPELRRRAASFRDRCESAAWDATLGRLFVEAAEDALAAETPDERSLREARAVLLHVLPRYFELHEETP